MSFSSNHLLWKSSFTFNSRVVQHYNIVEDLAQLTSAMPGLEVLQSYRMQWKSLLSAIGAIDPSDLSLISFDL